MLDLRILRTKKGRDLRQSSGQRPLNLYPHPSCVKQIALCNAMCNLLGELPAFFHRPAFKTSPAASALRETPAEFPPHLLELDRE